MKQLAKRLWIEEGFRKKPYLVENVPHIGVGRNLAGRGITADEFDISVQVSEVDIDDFPVTETGYIYLSFEQAQVLWPDGIDMEAAVFFLQNDIAVAVHDASTFLGIVHFRDLTVVQQDALTEMAFNLGYPHLKLFRKLKKALLAIPSNWDAVRKEVHVGDPGLANRYERIASELSTGVRAMLPELPPETEAAIDRTFGLYPTAEARKKSPDTLIFLDVCLDFDGTLAQYKGWKSLTSTAEPPMPEAIETLLSWQAAGLRVGVFSSRSVEDKGIAAMKAWIVRHTPDGQDLVDWLFWPRVKPAATLYVDDRGWRPPEGGALPTVAEIKAFKPWYQE